ncbi:MAG TPA: hypothetical protein VG826_07935 [Pirellulales bacterium]|nr:hypothetical protein [Pirellulales bacterium]
MQRKRVSLKKRIAVQAGLAACVALVGLLSWTTWRETLLAAYWEDELTAIDGQQEDAGGASAACNEAVERLLKLGRPGLAAVVRTLGHPRDEVSWAAWSALARLLNRCENGPPSQTASVVEDAARSLAENIDRLPVASRPRAARLAMRIVALLQKSPAIDSGEITAACDRVLRACDGSADALAASTEDLSNPATVWETESLERDEPDQVVHARTVLPPDHSMYLELAELAPPDLPRADGTSDVQPRLLLSSEARPLATSSPAGASPVASVNTDRVGNGAESDPGTSTAQRLQEVDSVDLFALLNGADDAQAAAELAERGFSPRQIEVGRHLVSRDAAERLRWVEVLPGIRGVDARFWLLRLSRDTNVHVRRSAVGLLATDRDPEVIRRLRQIAIEETDADLRDQASRALEVLEGEP